MSKTTGNNRISALKRLGMSSPTTNPNRRQLIGSNNSSVTDARELLNNRNKSSFDARQLLTRQSSKTFDKGTTNVIIRKTVSQNIEKFDDNDNGQMVVVTGVKDMKVKQGRLFPTTSTANNQLEKTKKIYAVGSSTFVTIRNNNNNNNNANNAFNISSEPSTEKISLTKTITNKSISLNDTDDRPSQVFNTQSSMANEKVVIRFVNDQYKKTPDPLPLTVSSSSSPILSRDPPPTVKRLHDACIQTTPSSPASRSPIRINSHRRQASTTIEEQDQITNRTIDDELYEPPVKRSTMSTRKTAATDKEQQVLSTGSVKRTSTGAPVSSRITSNTSTMSKSTTESNSQPGIILITNLQSSVTEEDVIELFSKIGRIDEITTLSQGCVQIVYAKREHAEQAVTKYHNRLLDGQFMYVSLQQSSSYSTTQNSKSTKNIQQSTTENGTSENSSSTVNQPLKLNATKNSSNKIAIDPTFIRQALFNPTNSTTNPVQFQVKL